jgi:putative phage-type endonuclease
MKKYHKQSKGKRSGEWVRCRAAKCRLNGEHINEFEHQQLRNAASVKRKLASTQDAAVRERFERIKEAMERPYVPVSSFGYPAAMTDAEADTAEASRLISEGSEEEMEAFLSRRINAEAFTELLARRKSNQEVLETLTADRDVLLKQWQSDGQFFYEDVRQKELMMNDVNEELILLGRQINEYKDISAPVVSRVADLEEERMRANGEWLEYDEETLNDLSRTAMFDSGTREWLEQRQNGAGGSDIGPIVGVHGTYNSRADIMDSKINPITDEQVEEQGSGHSEFSGAAGRGNAWEKRIFLDVKKRHPELNVTFCKASWKNNNNPFQFANFDGLLVDENGKPDGILEIKTASVAGKWGKPEDGLDGVPATYRTQVLWYAQAAGFKRGMVAVMIDDREYREYHFTMTPELEEEANRNLEKVRTFMTEVDARKNGTWEARTRSRGFSLNALNSSLANREKKEIFAEVAMMRGTAPETVEQEFAAGFDDENRKDRTFVESRLRNLYVETAKRTDLPDYVGVDLETAGSVPTNGRILEFGASLRTGYSGDAGGTVVCEKEKLSKLYGLSRKTLAARSTGNSEVHGIMEGQVAKKRQFSNPVEGARVLTMLKRANFMLAHNASFENRWMKTYVPGYADAVRKGEIGIVDSAKLNRRLFSDSTPNDKLESYTARFDVPYINSHRAYADTVMMSISYERMLKELRASV